MHLGWAFLKPFLKGKILRSGEWERGKFDFDHYFAFLTNFLQIKNFLLSGILFGSSRGLFSIKNLSKMDFSFRFCKIGLRNTLFIFGRKNGRLLFVLFVCLFVATLSDFAYFFLIEALIEPGNCPTPKVLIFCRFSGFTKMQLT